MSAALSLAMLLLFALVIVRMGWVDLLPGKVNQHLTSVTLTAAGASAKGEQPKNKKPVVVKQTVPVPHLPAIPPPRLIVPNPKAPPAAFIPLSSADMAAADISKMGKSASGNSPGNSSATYGPGEGPQGQRLFKAEWFREPTDAEIGGYLTEQSAKARWAEIACRTIEDNHVDNCQTLGESPLGSGLARSLRQAAWQFLIRPPRIDGKPQIGTWVRIHFDFVRGEAN